MAEGDVPGTTGDATAGDGQEAVWRDLVARFDAPAPADGEAPWPELEDLDGPVHVTPAPPSAMPPPVMPPALIGWELDMAERGSLDLLGPSTKRALTAVLEG
ncbi:MAG: hypothetical protein WAK28_04865, partial [Trebonia sp.]